MPRQPRRKVTYYETWALHDRTVLAALPIRKPSPQERKRSCGRIDADGVAIVSATSGRELLQTPLEKRIRFLDIIAANLNTRRAIRDLVIPKLDEILEEVRGLKQLVGQR